MAVTNEKGFPIQTKKARLKRSLLTGKYILFGSSDEGDQLIESEFSCDDNVDVNSVGVMYVD